MKLTRAEYLKLQANNKAKRVLKREELTQVQLPFIQWFYREFKPRFKRARLVVNPFADMSFGQEKVMHMGRMIPISQKFRMRAKEMGWVAGEPDVVIHCRFEIWSGLAFEFKKPGFSAYRQDGNLKKDSHLEKQYEALMDYRANGYYADFINSYEDAVRLARKHYKF